MTKEDIELKVWTTMAEATACPLAKEQLMTKIESARYDEFVRFEKKKQARLRIILDVLVGLLLLNALQLVVPLLALPQVPHPVPPISHATGQPWWQF